VSGSQSFDGSSILPAIKKALAYFRENNIPVQLDDKLLMFDRITPLNGSRILNNNAKHLCLLHKWIDPKYSIMELLYRGSQDGFKRENLHNKCDGKGATVTLV